MRFSKSVTFNTHDSSVTKGEDGRIAIDRTRGVKTRCELCINALLRPGFGKGAKVEMLVDHLNTRLGANYTENDIRHALDRLVTAKVISNHEGTYRATATTVERWRKQRSA